MFFFNATRGVERVKSSLQVLRNIVQWLEEGEVTYHNGFCIQLELWNATMSKYERLLRGVDIPKGLQGYPRQYLYEILTYWEDRELLSIRSGMQIRVKNLILLYDVIEKEENQ